MHKVLIVAATAFATIAVSFTLTGAGNGAPDQRARNSAKPKRR